MSSYIMTLFFLENAEKYKNIVHQRDVWHGGKSIAKKKFLP